MSQVPTSDQLGAEEIVFYFDTASNEPVAAQRVTRFVNAATLAITSFNDVPPGAVVEIVSISTGSLLVRLRVWIRDPNAWVGLAGLAIALASHLRAEPSPNPDYNSVTHSAAEIIVAGNGNHVVVIGGGETHRVEASDMPAVQNIRDGGELTPLESITPRIIGPDSKLTLVLKDANRDDLQDFPVNGVTFELDGREYTISLTRGVQSTYGNFTAGLNLALKANPDTASLRAALNPDKTITITDPMGRAFRPGVFTFVNNRMMNNTGHLTWTQVIGDGSSLTESK